MSSGGSKKRPDVGRRNTEPLFENEPGKPTTPKITSLDAAMSFSLHIERHWRGASEAGCSAATSPSCHDNA
jgi:hypothetical protein